MDDPTLSIIITIVIGVTVVLTLIFHFMPSGGSGEGGDGGDGGGGGGDGGGS